MLLSYALMYNSQNEIQYRGEKTTRNSFVIKQEWKRWGPRRERRVSLEGAAGAGARGTSLSPRARNERRKCCIHLLRVTNYLRFSSTSAIRNIGSSFLKEMKRFSPRSRWNCTKSINETTLVALKKLLIADNPRF